MKFEVSRLSVIPMNKIPIFLFGFLSAAVLLPPRLSALQAADILIIYNNSMRTSKEVAMHYAGKRGVPAANILGFDLPETESISREGYEKRLSEPLRQELKKIMPEHDSPALLLVYGVPLLISGDDEDDQRSLKQLSKDKISQLTRQLAYNAERLQLKTGQDSRHRTPFKDDPEEVLKQAQEVFKESLVRMSQPELPKPPYDMLEINAILVRMGGISLIANAALKQEEMQLSERKEPLQAVPLYQLNDLMAVQISRAWFRGVMAENALDQASVFTMSRGLIGELQFWLNLKNEKMEGQNVASVDSELSLVLGEPYIKDKWLPNPFLEKYDSYPGIQSIRATTLMVSRLDGPAPEIAMRLVDDAIDTEETGLAGTFYIDARGLEVKKEDYYSSYDQQLINLHTLVKEKGLIPVTLDTRSDLFPANSCPDAALYCGWYSLQKYVPAFTWKKGSIGFHVASAEAVTLRKAGNQAWCQRMLEEGVAATIGPVQEPYLQSFPLPGLFFPLLMTGKLPLVEVYYRTTPYLSWRQVLIGDPLYRPFNKAPAIRD